MFESDEKKYLRKKYQGLSSSSKLKKQAVLVEDSYKAHQKPKTVYSELKLSEQLSGQLETLRDRFDGLRENLEETEYQRDLYHKELSELRA